MNDLHFDAIRAENDSAHFWASSGGGRADNEDSVLLRRRNPRRSRISDLSTVNSKNEMINSNCQSIRKSLKLEPITIVFSLIERERERGGDNGTDRLKYWKKNLLFCWLFSLMLRVGFLVAPANVKFNDSKTFLVLRKDSPRWWMSRTVWIIFRQRRKISEMVSKRKFWAPKWIEFTFGYLKNN